jgi:glycosyltransferase involved in cell wall biosynthesis
MLCKFAGGANERIVETIFEGSSSTYIKWGCEGADWLYAMYIENFEYTRYAKRCGVKILADIYENPYIFYDLANEVEALPELRCIAYLRKEFLAQYKLRMKYVDQLLAIADQYLIPSEYVKNELAKNSSAFVESRANIIPYVSSVTNQRYDNVPVKGRIIWVGNDPVRKGLVYALRAFKLLKAKYSFVEFRIIGPMPPEIVQSEYFEDVDFRGYLNKEQLKEEFRQADIYVFPTLSEGFAGSLLEAASFGVPIVTTHASGFGGDFPGLFVREKNVNDIVESISLLMEDRDRRTAISYQLFNYSQKFGKDAFTHKLLRLLHRK